MSKVYPFFLKQSLVLNWSCIIPNMVGYTICPTNSKQNYIIFLYFCRAQGDLYRVQHKFEGAQQEVDRLSADLEKSNYMASKHKDEHKNVTDELHALQEEFDESSLQLSR